MKRLTMAISAFFFLAGCLVVLAAWFLSWAYLMIKTAQWHVFAGWLVLVGSIAAYVWYRVNLDPPWRAWFQVWRWADAELERRLKGSEASAVDRVPMGSPPPRARGAAGAEDVNDG